MFEQVCTIDFESRSACDLKKCGAWVYSQHPTTEVLCLWFCWHDGRVERWLPGEPMPAWLPVAIEGGVVFECHGALFERSMWANQMIKVWHWPDIPPEQWHDTQAVCARKAIPLDLEHASKLLGLEVKKNEAGAAALQKICKPVSKTKFYFNEDPDLLALVTGDYGRDDTLSQMHLSKRLGYLEPRERDIWLLNQRMNLRGLQIDLKFAADCQAVYDKATAPIARTFADITGGMKPGSPKLKDLLNEAIGDACPHFPNMKKETVEEALKEWDLPDAVRSLVEMRSALTSASVKKLRSMRDCSGSDGRARGLIQYHAATTGRDGGRLLQPQNFPRGSVELGKDLDGTPVPPWEFLIPAIQSRDAAFIGANLAHLEEHISEEFREMLAPVSAVTSALRSCLVAGKGRFLCAGDFSTIEVRVLLGIAGQHDKLKMIADGLDPYLDFADDVEPLGLSGDTKQDKKTFAKVRQDIGKPGVLGCGFQMGADKLWRKDGKGRWGMDTAERIIQTYRKEWAPEVPKLWYGLQEASTKAVWDRRPQEYNGIVYALEDGWLTCRLPSDRKLYYFNPRKTKRHMPWSTEENPDIRDGWSYTAKKQGKLVTVDAYGGLLTENVVQAGARDVMYDRALVADAEGLPLVLTVHDENVTEPEAHRSDAEKCLQQIMEDAPAWARALGIPIAAECWVGDRYRK